MIAIKKITANILSKRYAVSGVIEGYYLQLMDMLEDYYDYLDVNLEDKEF